MTHKPATCETCRWWKTRGNSMEMEARGECHGAPPQIKREARGGHYEPAGYRLWPITDRDDYCAKHGPTEEADRRAARMQRGEP